MPAGVAAGRVNLRPAATRILDQQRGCSGLLAGREGNAVQRGEQEGVERRMANNEHVAIGHYFQPSGTEVPYLNREEKIMNRTCARRQNGDEFGMPQLERASEVDDAGAVEAVGGSGE